MIVQSSVYTWPSMAAPNPQAGNDIASGAQSSSYGSPAPSSMIPPQGAGGALQALAQFTPAQFGNGQLIPVLFAGAGDLLVLPRPTTGQRVWLLIINDLAASVIRVNFDNVASATVGISIQPTGNLFCDAFVPQNDIHIFAPIAGGITVAYCVEDATDPTRVLQANS